MNNPLKQRRAGVLLHPTSLPSGKIDEQAIHWLDFMKSADLSVWQVLPLGVPQHSFSPYLCNSAFAMNPALLDDDSDINPDNEDYKSWCEQQRFWLTDYADYCILREKYQQLPWYDWPQQYKDRDEAAIHQLHADSADEIQAITWQQFQLDKRWQQVKQAATDRGIYLFGDMPIFVAHDSADVWAHRECFLLDEHGQPALVAGVPPDYFSETGQRWGNPHYDWKHLATTGFEWWMQRMEHHYRLFDIVRIDHFRGLQATWMIDAKCPTAIDGYWEEVPGEDLLAALKARLGDVPIVAEDLGLITPEVIALRDQFELPGMSVLQFSFDGFEDNPHKPENIVSNRVVYTGTHDNDTTLGWYTTLETSEQDFVWERLKQEKTDDICSAMIDETFATKGNLAIIPLQDFLKLDSSARMNTPGTVDNNWLWRFQWQDIPDSLPSEIARTVTQHHRKEIDQ
ncbi:4-alpha-glucanotransferase [Leucothrix pacifica]|uniref:4-alpha-glucanotransferase n=1 Tax=Leucothrix pacifica TaxID=1247513 RepID=UPI001FE69650|nr:4-alpha-glucanotransferase [Leucothrix pacifica]